MRIVVLTTDNREPHKDYANPQPHFGTAPAALLQGLAMIPEIEVHVVSCIRQPVRSPEKIAANTFFHSLVVPKIGWMKTLFQGCVRAARKKIQEIQPDIVHGQGTEADCSLSAIYSGFPNVLTLHGNMRSVARTNGDAPFSYNWIAARLENFVLPRTAGVFCNSAYTERLVAPCASEIWRVPNAVRDLFFETPLLPAPRAVPVFLNVATLTPYKRQREILALAGNLWRRGLKFELHFVGTRENRTAYGLAFERELALAQAAGYARHIGILPTDQLIAAMDAASALIHSPTEEAFGLVVAEALARNLKFFGSTTGGIGDIAAGVEGAELFAPQNWTGMESAIAKWIETGGPRPVGAATVMRERYHPQVVARRHLEIYRQVLGKIQSR